MKNRHKLDITMLADIVDPFDQTLLAKVAECKTLYEDVIEVSADYVRRIVAVVLRYDTIEEFNVDSKAEYSA